MWHNFIKTLKRFAKWSWATLSRRIVSTLIIIGLISLSVWFLFLRTSGSQAEKMLSGIYLKEEISFLKNQGFLSDISALLQSSQSQEQILALLKPQSLIEQELDNFDESFKILAVKLDTKNSSYRMAFSLENKTSQDKEFYLIPVSDESQLRFEEIRGAVIPGLLSRHSEPEGRRISLTGGKGTGSFASLSMPAGEAGMTEGEVRMTEEGSQDDKLEDLYDVQQHKSELIPELARAYDKIEKDNYRPHPVKLTLSANSSYLAQSIWKINNFDEKRKLVYLLIYGSAGGAKDDLTGYYDINNITGVELLIRTRDKHPEASDRRGYLDRGDIISMAEYGHQWSESERNALDRMILRLPGITQEDLGEYLLPEYDKDPQIHQEARVVKQRRYKIDLDRLSEITPRNLRDQQTPASDRLDLFESLIKDTSTIK